MNLSPSRIAILGSITIASFAILSPAFAQAPTHTPVATRTITLTGHGQVHAAPDMAIIRVGVVRQAKTARIAVSQNNQAMQNVITVVGEYGVAKKDTQTSGFSLAPRYVYPRPSKSGPQKPPRIVGYSASNNLAITVRKLVDVGDILDAVISAGSNNVGGIQFSIQNPKPLRNQARRLAMQDAIAKAKLYASEGGFTLGAIISVSEFSQNNRSRPAFQAGRAAAQFKRARVPIAQGEQSITMRVNVVWEIK